MKTVILMILNFLLILPAALSQESNTTQESNKSKVSFGFNIGGGQNSNGYRLTPDDYGFEYYEGDALFTTGLNVSMFVTERLRPRFEFAYSEMKYGLIWGDSYTNFDKTVTKTMNLNLNLNLDYLVLNGKKFQLFFSPGIVTEYVVGSTHKNYHTDGTTNMNNYNPITDQYPKSIAGANFSILAKYKLTEHVGLTVTPGYNYYFRKYVTTNDKPYTRSLLNFGVEYTF
ncbi:MAG: hypothetical protein WC384_21505 [Prolixibacteraceae bacterium]|jgi:hypothetical protein